MSRTHPPAPPALLLAVGLATGCAAPSSPPYAAPPAPARPDAYLASLCDELRREWPDNRTVNVVCHGHSVPAGYFVTPVVDGFHAYPALLHRGLEERFPHAVLNVIVTAIGGETSVAGAERFERDVLTHRPDLVTIDYALNDRRVGLEAARAAWTGMLDAAERAGVPVLLLTPTPDLRADLQDPDDPLVRHAEQVRELALERGVGLVDSLAAFRAAYAEGVAPADLMSIPNHPNARGHELVARELLAWFPAAEGR